MLPQRSWTFLPPAQTFQLYPVLSRRHSGQGYSRPHSPTAAPLRHLRIQQNCTNLQGLSNPLLSLSLLLSPDLDDQTRGPNSRFAPSCGLESLAQPRASKTSDLDLLARFSLRSPYSAVQHFCSRSRFDREDKHSSCTSGAHGGISLNAVSGTLSQIGFLTDSFQASAHGKGTCPPSLRLESQNGSYARVSEHLPPMAGPQLIKQSKTGSLFVLFQHPTK